MGQGSASKEVFVDQGTGTYVLVLDEYIEQLEELAHIQLDAISLTN
ncbi:MAG: hypothetical protein H6765_05405 [Candidatus Peribacteria bacterium]|nr:MAG: hypothetical protein H6765_05405 [Candidatus Peribacteria bacterium]